MPTHWLHTGWHHRSAEAPGPPQVLLVAGMTSSAPTQRSWVQGPGAGPLSPLTQGLGGLRHHLHIWLASDPVPHVQKPWLPGPCSRAHEQVLSSLLSPSTICFFLWSQSSLREPMSSHVARALLWYRSLMTLFLPFSSLHNHVFPVSTSLSHIHLTRALSCPAGPWHLPPSLAPADAGPSLAAVLYSFRVPLWESPRLGGVLGPL